MKKIYFLIPVMLIVGLFGGYIVGHQFGVRSVNCQIDPNDTYAAGWQAAKDRLAETGYYYQLDMSPVQEILGKIERIEGNSISIKIFPLSPLAEKALDTRIIDVNPNTQISKITEKTQAEYMAELAEYEKNHGSESASPILPEDYPKMTEEGTGSISDFKIGQEVQAYTDTDIRDIKEFTANKITIRTVDSNIIQ